VLVRDDEVDALRRRTFRLLVDHMSREPACIEPGIDLLLITRQLERAADHATNVAESTIFLVEALDVRHASNRADRF
jgi:phosphate transport system protein